VGIQCGVPAKPTRYQHQRCLHFITFSCYRREPLLDTVTARVIFEKELERVRRWYGCRRKQMGILPTVRFIHPPAKSAGRVGQP